MMWWSRLWRRNKLEQDLGRELQFHVAERISALRGTGVSEDEARRQTRQEFGGIEQVKEECRNARGTRGLEDLLQDGRYALRTFRQKPGFAVVTLLILALGVGATTVMFAVINSVLLRPLPFTESDRLVTVHGSMEQLGDFWGLSNPDLTDIRQDSQSLVLAAWAYGGGTISAPGRPEYCDGRKISAGLFTTLGVIPLGGRAFNPDQDRPGAAPVAVISYSLWQRRFSGDPSAVGKPLIFDGKTYTVVGIAPAGFQLSGDADVFTPLGQSTDPRQQNRAARFIQVIARLRPGVSMAAAQSELTAIANHLAEEYPKSNKGFTMQVHPLQQELVRDVQGTLWLLLAAVGFVLLIACVNIASLFLTRAISRERELAMRAALGAGWSRLARQCLTESAVLGICGGLLGFLLARLSLRPFVAFWPGNLPRAEEIHLDWRVFAFVIGVSLLSAFLFGLAPVLRVPLHSLEASLRTGGRTVAGGPRRLYSAFVISEIALAFVLLISAGMLGNTLIKLSSLDPGLNVHNILTARFAISPSALVNPKQIQSAWQDVLDRARSLPGVKSAALADIIPMREGENTIPYRTTAAPLPPNQEPIALASTVTPDYANVMGIPLREGRFFNDYDHDGSEPVVVIDENLAQHAFRGQSAVGKRLWSPVFGNRPVQIVGVVGHVRHWGLAGDDQSRVRDQMYYPFAQVPAPLLRFFSSVMSIAVRTKASPLNLLEPLRLELRGASGDQALYEPRTMEQLVSASLGRQRFLLFLFGIFAGLALLLASIGLYGVLAYLTRLRVPEIGLRMALGATARSVIGLVFRQCLQMVIVGLSAGILVSLGAGRVLQRLVQGMQPVHFVTFVIMISLLVSVALVAGFVPALRASRVDPVKALREE